MKLSQNNIQAIEGFLNADSVVELHLTVEGVLVTARPKDTADISVPYPMLLSSEEECSLRVTTQTPSSGPVDLLQCKVPPGFCFAGIKGYQSKTQ